ncbi:MAG: AraC family transcriptional regulator [Desulfobacteraceae bacterium]|nr:AraC family transcriptional regulator [Desulfobacteraceae bacterium]
MAKNIELSHCMQTPQDCHKSFGIILWPLETNKNHTAWSVCGYDAYTYGSLSVTTQKLTVLKIMKQKYKEAIYFIDLPNIMEASVVIGQNVKNDFPRHVHNAFCIGTIDKGARLIEENGATQTINRNEVFVINSGVPHRCKSLNDQGHSYRAINIKPHVLKALGMQISEKMYDVPYFKHSSIKDPLILRHINKFFSCINHENTSLEKEEALLSLLSEIILKYSKNPPVACNLGRRRQAVGNACDYMRSNYARKITLAQLSKESGLSSFHFQKVFLKEKGVSPNDYLFKIRTDKAAVLLLKGESITDVAFATGFTDQSHFTKCFKRFIGITPGRYRYLQSASLFCSHTPQRNDEHLKDSRPNRSAST